MHSVMFGTDLASSQHRGRTMHRAGSTEDTTERVIIAQWKENHTDRADAQETSKTRREVCG